MMTSRYERRETAMRNLLAIPQEATFPEPEAYPEEFTIPEAIHEVALQALSATLVDERERSVHFRCKDDQWKAGMSVKGPKLGQNGASNNVLHTFSAVMWPPHLHFHTHPTMTKSLIEAVFTSKIPNVNVALPGNQEVIERLVAGNAQSSRLASSDDISKTIKDPLGSIGHMLIAEGGIFMWLHRDLQFCKGALVYPGGGGYHKQAQEAHQRKRYVECSDTLTYQEIRTGGGPSEKTQQAFIDARVRALGKHYICYVNDNPNESLVTKQPVTIDSVDPQRVSAQT